MANTDRKLINSVKSNIATLLPKYIDEAGLQGRNIEHPLDIMVMHKLDAFEIRDADDDYRIFNYVAEIKEVWELIIEKSVKCLRYFDKREPYFENTTKRPVAYGVKELSEYFEKYTQFETMLYGGGKYYRDHVVHVFRVWLLGLDCLLEKEGDYLNRIDVQKGIVVNSLEKLSIWSMIALTHDLGYPLEKSQGIIEKTKDMMKSFISNPTVNMDLSFNGIQNNMNDFVVRFISSKMREKKEPTTRETPDGTQPTREKKYVARLQPKYYFKFQKSLEGYKHGILSAIVIYKLLIYFLESDFSINEDYEFDGEETRQFYIRREILRTISAHTCYDVYHLDMLSFAFLLIVVDDAQEWGRKKITELYVKQSSSYLFDNISPYFDTAESMHDGETIKIHKFVAKEKFDFSEGEIDNLKTLLASLMQQSKRYEGIFRDGQDTAKRNFIFEKCCEVVYNTTKNVTFHVRFEISNDGKPVFEVRVDSSNEKDIRETYGKRFFEDLYKDYNVSNPTKAATTEATYCVEERNE